MDTSFILLGISLIIIFGFFAEFMFKKLGVSDILLLVLLGFAIGPHGLRFIDPLSIELFAPVFTTFALLFLLFDGALNIDLHSFAKGLVPGFSLSLFNFIISSAVITLILYLFKLDFMIALLIGFTLGGVSSAFVIPLLKQIGAKGEVYTVLTLESALTDVFTIVFSLTVMQLIKINVFSFKEVFSQISSLFAVAGLIGVIGASLWIFLDKRVFKENKSFMSTIAILILIYLITDFLGGNGAIAALFFGLVLKNSKQLTTIVTDMAAKTEKEAVAKEEMGFNALTESEHMFYNQISFFLKTFFFVYIGLLLNISDSRAMLIGGILAIVIMIVRNLNLLVTKKLSSQDRSLVSSLFARGLAAAAIIQILVTEKIITSPLIPNITYFFIVCTILLSSIRVFLHKMRFKAEAVA
ncbi:MAG: cation:proton antiporter [archaeon]